MRLNKQPMRAASHFPGSNMRPAIIGTMIVCMSFLSVPFISIMASADQYADWVFGPTAISYDCTDPTYFMGLQIGGVMGPNYTTKLDGINALMIEGSWLRTWDFTSTDVAQYWDPYSNRTDFPPNNATIEWVAIEFVGYVAPGSQSSLHLRLDENVSGNLRHVIGEFSFMAMTFPTQHQFDVTNYYDWTPAVLNNHSLISANLSVSMVIGGSLLAVDYLGLNYRWYYNESAPPNPPSGPAFPKLTINISAIFGMVGFIGMIGTLPVAVWYYRQTERSRIEVAVYALIIFCIFFALFTVGAG